MQPGMRVALATTFWLAVLVAGTVGHHPAGRLIFDQYSSPFDPHQYGVYRRAGGQPDWKDQDPVEKNHPFDPSINPPRSITNTGHDGQSHRHGTKYTSVDFSPSSPSNKRILKSKESLSRLEESFVADDTFQDQGPGSLEIYKLDLLRERPLLHGHQVTMFPSDNKGKSKAPKKTGHAETWKPKPDYLPMLLRKQSNTFDEPSTEVPPFGVGGVPELQVGCEGLEAAHYKERRSIGEGGGRDNEARDPWMLDVTPITLDLDYEAGGEEEEEEEEMDELLKLKRLETTTDGVKRNRGDMDAKLHSEFHSEKGAEKLPVRGDLGSSLKNGTRRIDALSSSSSSSSSPPSRRILWTEEEEGEGEGGREKRALWGFGESEGVVGSEELQTENQRRRMYEESRRREGERRRVESEIERIRGEYEGSLEERRREEEERQRRLNRWQLEERDGRERQGEEEARRRLEERKREWLSKQRKEEERRRDSNLIAEERERQRKLDESPPPRHHHQHHHRYQQEQKRKEEQERKLLEYVRRNQPVHLSNDSHDRSLAEQRRRMEEVRRIYNPGNGRRNHGPSANIDPRSYVEEGRRRMQEEEEEERRRGREERMREAERREEEERRRMSRWYEGERRRKEAARLEAERMAKVQREEEARRAAGGYGRRGLVDDHRRRQDLVPANLVLNETRRRPVVVERARQRQEEVERRRQEERRAKEAREREERDRVMKEQWRRQEEARLNALPVSARIIVQPQKPRLVSRIGGIDIDFLGANPFQGGVRFPNFPAPPTRRPVQSPPPCVWAVIQCCPSNQRLVTCFESLGCPGVNWDSNPCRDSVSQAARAQVEKFYRETEDEEERY
ncbi:trichohyalin isoform X2 [Apis mellifera]|nr:trichohyalin isoform X2 [Apis mellifera]XP_026299365.1 trichohyalin isoform X2 [Apis mellifera]XP_026299366.1 trichohyalin isoform X2 [Apis mellifera]XP_026299367.1 trichohyalin isoform X2 [Apis mellifera]XP_026299368.1 trichohyalin isoform X2 [Apis mellifera]XP_026299369.1 trichohyalin isoform X2 [Apis mellifera]|eukprot:XP_026299364.1 trichohyalin isoform X2 [Apis mellifera]